MNRLTMRSKKMSKSFWKQMKMNIQQSKSWDTANAFLRGRFIDTTGLPKKHRNILNKQPNPKYIRTGGTNNNKNLNN